MARVSESMSWERTACAAADGAGEQLLVFGYSARLFQDDAQASLVDEGGCLVPCPGREDVLIDRFDVRGFLPCDHSCQEEKCDLTPEVTDFEKRLDEERFRDLMTEETADAHDQEMKRLHHELASVGAYSQVAFEYSTESPATTLDSLGDSKEVGQESDYRTPDYLTLPEGVVQPKTMKDHLLIEKTARFILKNGPQMEIVLKMKQSTNPAFSFLSFDSPLNQYFKIVLSAVKSGKCPQDSPTEPATNHGVTGNDGDTSESEDDGSYLHPSLMGKSSSAKPQHTTVDEGSKQQALPVTGTPSSVSAPAPVARASNPESKPSKFSVLPPPPPELEQVIDKLARKVALAGDEFESSIRRRGDPRFDFLNPGNCFHAYYLRLKLRYLDERREELADTSKPPASVGASRGISFSISKTRSAGVSEEVVKESKDRVAVAAEGPSDSRPRDKLLQEERKRKAALFLSILKTRQEAEKQETESTDDPPNRQSPRTEEPQRKKHSGSSSPSRSERRARERESRRRSRSRDRRRHSRERSRSRDKSRERCSRKGVRSRRRSRSRSR